VSGTCEVTVKHNLRALKHKTVLPSTHTAKKRQDTYCMGKMNVELLVSEHKELYDNIYISISLIIV